MRIFLLVPLFCAALWAAPQLLGVDAVLAALLSVAGAVTLSALCVGALTPASAAGGAVGAFAFMALAPYSLPLAGAVSMACVFAARSLRARTVLWGAAHALVALLCGAAGAWIVHSFGAGALSVRIAAVGVGGIVAAAPLLVPVDDAVCFALRTLAGQATGALRWRLLRAAILRRRCDGVSELLSRQARRRMDRAFQALVVTARARLDRSRPGGELLDRRIRAYVSALGRALRAAESASALTTDLDDKILAELRLEKDDLEARVEGLNEVVSDDPPADQPAEARPS